MNYFNFLKRQDWITYFILFFQDCILGLEFSGRDSKGKRVMGMLAARGLATSVLADPGFLWEVPSKWTLEQASTIPVVYGTVRYYTYIIFTNKSNNIYFSSGLLCTLCKRPNEAW